MDIGMLWFDNDKKASVPARVERAARYYQEKYGKKPDLCYIHPKMVKGKNGKKNGGEKASPKFPLKIGKILVLKNEKVLPDHFWIGISTGEERINSGG
jgi:hypothetical protein